MTLTRLWPTGSRTKPAISSATRAGLSSGEKVSESSIHSSRAFGSSRARPSACRGREQLVLARPGDQSRPVELAEPVRGLVGVAGVEAAHDLLHVAVDPRQRERRQHVRVLGLAVDRPLGHPAEGDRQAAREPEAQRHQGRLHRPGDPDRHLQEGERRRREVVAVVARGEHEPPDALWTVGDHDLADGSAGVIADERHVLEPERLDRVRDEVGRPHRSEVCALRHRQLVARPSGSSSAMQRKSGDSFATTFRHRFGFTRKPCTKTIGSPDPASKQRIFPPGRSSSRAVPRPGRARLPSPWCSYRLYLTYRRYACQGPGLGWPPWRGGAARPSSRRPPGRCSSAWRARALHGARLRGRRHRGDRAAGQGHARRALPPLPRQEGPLPRRARGARGGAGREDRQAAGGGRRRGPGRAAGHRGAHLPRPLHRAARADHPGGRAVGARLGGVARDRRAARPGPRDGRPPGRDGTPARSASSR